jgi:hypothetical protein
VRCSPCRHGPAHRGGHPYPFPRRPRRGAPPGADVRDAWRPWRSYALRHLRTAGEPVPGTGRSGRGAR